MWGSGDGGSTPDYFDENHEGHPGFTSDDLVLFTGQFAAAAHPDIVLLMIGANDADRGYPVERTFANVRQVIKTLRGSNTHVAVLLARPTPVRGLGARIRLIGDAMASLALRMNRLESPVLVVDMNTSMSPHLCTIDGTHLNPAGEKKVANRWFRALLNVLPHYG
jgi:lysophospholipase L1-like esterase